MEVIKKINLTKLRDEFKLKFISLFSEHEYYVWLDCIILYKLDIKDKKIILIVPNFFVLKYIEDNYLDYINNFYNDKYNINFVIKLALKRFSTEIITSNISSNNINLNILPNDNFDKISISNKTTNFKKKLNNNLKNTQVQQNLNKLSNNLKKLNNNLEDTKIQNNLNKLNSDFSHIGNSFNHINSFLKENIDK
ncbi:MAG: DnaA N-terminal domain-containing protein [Rickettsiales bacterium]